MTNSQHIIGIDPGNEKSAWCVLQDGVPVVFAKERNEAILERMYFADWKGCEPGTACIEMVQCLGMAVGFEVFDTAFWTGRFVQAWPGEPMERLLRTDVKLHLCHSMRAKDSNIRQALIDRFGGDSKAIGGKKCGKCKGKGWVGRGRPTCDVCDGEKWEHPPGPLHGISVDVWAALAVGVTYFDTHESS